MAETFSVPKATVVYIPSAERHAHTPTTWIEKAPGVCGGEARIRRTRIHVWGLVAYRQQGMSDSDLLRGFPTLTSADLAAAWEYFEQSQAEIADAIVRNEVA